MEERRVELQEWLLATLTMHEHVARLLRGIAGGMACVHAHKVCPHTRIALRVLSVSCPSDVSAPLPPQRT